MATTKKVARSEAKSAPQSERRIKAAAASPPSNRIVSDSRVLIGAIRKDLAELWWYADQTLAGESGCSIEVARAEMAKIVCRLGLDLNHLDDEFAELVQS